MNREHKIYKITNLINGKIYIGRTIQKLRIRWLNHIYLSKSNKYNKYAIHKAIAKYGEKNFRIETIEKCKSFENMCKRESDYIKTLNSIQPNGYNLMVEDVGNDNKGEFCAKETKEKISISGHKNKRRNKTGYLGVKYNYGNINTKCWSAETDFEGKRIYKSFKTIEEAAEFIDKFIYFKFKENAILNFPDRKEYYSKITKEELYNCSKVKEKSSKFNYVSYNKKQKVYFALITNDRNARNGQLFCGTYKDENEAALIVDKIQYFLFEDLAKLNFPERVLEYQNENLEIVYNSFLLRKTNRHKFLSKYRGVCPRKLCGGSYHYVSTITFNKKIITNTFDTEIEAAIDYDKKAIAYFGEQTKINFPLEKYLVV